MELHTAFAERQQTFYRTSDGFVIKDNPHHHRLYHIEFDEHKLRQFFDATAGVDPQNLEYVPHMRFMLAKTLASLFGADLQDLLRGILLDRKSGGFTVGVQGLTASATDYIRFGTAISHLIGPGNFDAMSGTYYARFLVQDTDASDSYLRQAYRLFTLHTDGTFVDEATDWLLMMKFAERNAVGGESRLLHLDDWEELDRFARAPLASYEFSYKSPPSKNVAQFIKRRTFFKQQDKYCICFIDQFVQPETIAQAEYLHDLSASMEASHGTAAIPLPVGDLVMLNNYFWLHGRAPFEKDEKLHRELMRQRGMFSYA
jgi:protein CsiD